MIPLWLSPYWLATGRPLAADLAAWLRPHLFPVLESLMATLRDDLTALHASAATLKTATDAAAAANTTLASAQADTAAKTSMFAADLKAAGGEAIDTTPNADGTLTLYTSDGSAQGFHTESISTLDVAIPAPTPTPTPAPTPEPTPAPAA